MADPSLNSKDGQALVNKLAEVSANMRQAANLADAFAQSVAQLFPGTVVAPQPTVTGKKRGRVPKEGKRIKDPNAPKRPPTSYIMFQNDIREELRQKNPGLPYKELLGKVSEAWSTLGEDRKKAYQDVADTNMAKYNRAVIDYKGSLNGHAPAAAATSAVPTPEVDEEEEEEEEDEEEEVAPPTKKSKAEAPAPAVESDEESDAASTDSNTTTPPPVAQPAKKAKAPAAAAPASSGKEKKKAKK